MEWDDPPPPGHERPVAGRPAIDRHRERVKEKKKYAFQIDSAVACVPCSHVKVCVRVRGGIVSGAGKCGERAREQPGRWMAAASHSKS